MILVDGSQMLRRDGTGLTGYSRTLAKALKQTGAEVALLLDKQARPLPEGRDPAEIGMATQVFGNYHRPMRRLAKIARFLVKTRFGLRQRLPAYPVSTDLMRLASLEPPLPPHDALFNASEAATFANALFAFRRCLTEIDVPVPIALAHWTGPFPLKVRGVPNIYGLHDTIPLQMPHLVIDRPRISIPKHAAIVAAADHIVTLSESARQDIMRVLRVPEERITVTYLPAPELPPIERADAERLVADLYAATPDRYVIVCGAIEPRKNLERLIEAFCMAGTKMQLLLAGPPGWLFDDVTRLIDQIGTQSLVPARRRVRWLGRLPRSHIVALMMCSRFLAFPSLYEGFGLPVLEAMQLGVPVLTTHAGGLAELAGDAALIVDPLDVPAMARAVRTLAADADMRRDLSVRGLIQATRFSRAAYIDRLRSAYARVGVALPVPHEETAPAEQTGDAMPAREVYA